MKIGQTTGQTQLDQPQGTRAGQAKKETGAAPGAEAGAASVNISALSAQLHALESRLAEGGSFDAGRVEEIKQAIRSGSLKVNSEVVADRLIHSVRQLVGK